MKFQERLNFKKNITLQIHVNFRYPKAIGRPFNIFFIFFRGKCNLVGYYLDPNCSFENGKNMVSVMVELYNIFRFRVSVSIKVR